MLDERVTRRGFLKSAGAVSLAFTGLHQMMAIHGYAKPLRGTTVGFGPLVSDPNGILDLPAGFSYKIIATGGATMPDGLILPGLPDGMAAFPGTDGKTIIVCNHEVNTGTPNLGAFGNNNHLLGNVPAAKIYDIGRGTNPSLGGCSTLIFDTATQTLVSARLSLAGTLRNCAGGPTPWGSWITCEESTQRANFEFDEDHGYCFEVPAEMTGDLVTPVPLTAMGRFNHEAIAVDPHSGVVYLTEDRNDSLIYRFLPTTPGSLAAGGTLQALAITDRPSLDTRNWDSDLVAVGDRQSVEWITLTKVTAPLDDLRVRGFNLGAARFARGEGMWYGNGTVYFACTSGGSDQVGQIWSYQPSPLEGQSGEAAQPGKLELFVEPNDTGLIDRADNLTVAPWGDLIVCEDGTGSDRLVGITPEGEIYTFAENAVNSSELAGACFSPDGTTLFVNIQSLGYIVAITGPFRAAPLLDQWVAY